MPSVVSGCLHIHVLSISYHHEYKAEGNEEVGNGKHSHGGTDRKSQRCRSHTCEGQAEEVDEKLVYLWVQSWERGKVRDVLHTLTWFEQNIVDKV